MLVYFGQMHPVMQERVKLCRSFLGALPSSCVTATSAPERDLLEETTTVRQLALLPVQNS